MRQRLFWTVYFLDRRISLSCGRPYAIRDSDVDVDLPAWIDDKALYPDQPLPDAASENNYNAYLSCMVAFARFAGEIWDQIFSAAAAHTPELGEKIAILDTRIRYWLDTTLPSTPLLPSQEPPTTRQLWQHSLVRTVSSSQCNTNSTVEKTKR
ncbi:hypothetical protein VTK73DRAFT_9106 [Phialemonium thermophilum]|uniref:Xylanolytic transcriptional activator regulatory domain-containing protein n=1 Tax=Phialemonium thermophilum TaxID=223376 RepID=A0ABR3W4P1_9PEZI